MSKYNEVKEKYQAIGVNTENAIEKLMQIPISLHCWQGDDVGGFDNKTALSGGIQTTGDYIGKARTPDELMTDMEFAMSLMPSKQKLNLHASYAIFEGSDFADRDKLEPKHFKKWLDFAKKHNMGIDFNPTFFSHPKAKGLTLSSPEENIRKFWVEHGKACIKISEYFAVETGIPCVMNIWIPDGMKDIPADRLSPRARFKQSLDEILSIPYDKEKVLVCLESKVFGIGMESYTVGSSEFCLSYASRNNILPLMDNGHYHPTEAVSDKLSALLLFNEKVALHVTRPVRWDSDHVVLFDDETREIAKEIVTHGALDRVMLALDFFDASINRISAWVTGMRSLQKALLYALLLPINELKALQENGNFTELMVLQEDMKIYSFGYIWEEFCTRSGVKPDYIGEVKKYETDVLSKRGNA